MELQCRLSQLSQGTDPGLPGGTEQSRGFLHVEEEARGVRVRGKRSEKGLAGWLLPALQLEGQTASKSEKARISILP